MKAIVRNMFAARAFGAILQAAMGACALLLALTPVQAQDVWPNKPVKVVVPSSPGGGTDAYARILAQALQEQTKQNFVVENRPGASGGIGATAVAKSAPDGYTLLVASNSSTAVNPALYNNLTYDAEKDFAPISRGVMAPMILVVHPDTGYKSMADLVAAAKRAPETIAYGSAGNGSPLYLGVRMIEEAAGVKFSHVPYRGAGPAYVDLLAGRLKFMFTDLATIKQHIAAGKVLPLAINQKTNLAPGTPSFAEAGVPGIDIFTSFSVLAPAGTPAEVVRKISQEVGAAMRAPANAARLADQAFVPVADTPAEFAASQARERAAWKAFITRNGIQPD
jgi:tripartite-type tricarboxylate transporter receptor subunit TctC